MPELQIIGTPHSNFTWTTRIACVEKGVPYGHLPLRPHTPEVRSINPFGLIPVMRHGDVELKHATPGTPDGKPDRAAIDAALSLMPKQFAMLDRAVSPTGHLVGDAFTLADAYLVPILFFMTKLPESAEMLAGAKSLRRYFDLHAGRPSLRQTAPPPDYAASPSYYARWGARP